MAGVVVIDGLCDGVGESRHGVFLGIGKLAAVDGHEVVESVDIVRGTLETEVEEFEEDAEVLGSGLSLDDVGVLTECHVARYLLAGKFLGEFGAGEVADAGRCHHIAEELYVVDVALGELAGTALGACYEEHLRIVEVGLLEVDVRTVLKGPLGVAEVGSRFLCHLHGLGKRGNEGVVVHLVDESLGLCAETFLYGSAEGGGAGNGHVVLFGKEGEEDEVGVDVCGEFVESAVEGLVRKLLQKHLVVLVLRLDVGDGIAFEEVAYILGAVEGVLLLGTVVVDLFNARDELVLCTLDFGGGESVLADACHLGHHSLYGLGVVSGLGQHVDGEGVAGLGEDVVVVAGTGGHEGAFGVLCKVFETLVEDGGDDLRDAVLHQEHGCAAEFGGEGLMLEEHLGNGLGLLLVLVDAVDGFVVVGDGVELIGSLGLGVLDIGEILLDLAFHVVNINVAHHYDALEAGMVPLVVVVAEEVVREVVDDAHQTDGHALAVA